MPHVGPPASRRLSPSGRACAAAWAALPRGSRVGSWCATIMGASTCPTPSSGNLPFSASRARLPSCGLPRGTAAPSASSARSRRTCSGCTRSTPSRSSVRRCSSFGRATTQPGSSNGTGSRHLQPCGRTSFHSPHWPRNMQAGVSLIAGGTQARCGARPRSRCSGQKKLIEQAYTLGGQLGLSVWCEDEAGPFQAVPHPGVSWQPRGRPATQPHEYIRGGTTKILTLFHPASGQVRLQPATRGTNAVLHPWLRERLSAILDALPRAGSSQDAAATRAAWAVWQAGLTRPFTLPHDLPALRLLLVWDNLTGHKTPELVLWLCAHGVMPLYTPVGGSWLNMAESIERVLKRRALDGQHPQSPTEIGRWFEQTARAWNAQPTPFVWNGKRR